MDTPGSASWHCCSRGRIIALTFIDLDTKLLPDQITLPLLWLGLIVNLHSVDSRT